MLSISKNWSTAKWKANLLSEEDFQSVSTLMESGFSFSQSLHLLKTEQNRVVLSHILEKMEQGKPAEECLLEYVPKKYQTHMQNFLQFLPLLECIQLSIEIIRKQEKAQIQLRKGLVYPLCLLFGAGAGILLFNRTVLPAMLRLMSGFPMQDASFYLVQKVVEWILEAGMYCLSVFVFLLYVCTRRSRIVHTYCLCAKHGKNSLFVQYVSYQFVQYYEEFVKKKISTRRSIEILKCMKTQPVIVFLAEEMEKKFLSGETFQQTIESVYIEDTLARFFKVAVYSSKVEEMLEGYLHLCQTRIEKQIRQFTRVVQIISYTMIGILIVFVYRILMLPMTMLQNI